MEPPAWLPQLPEWVPYPFIVWFVVEGAVLAVLGVLLRDLVGPASSTAVLLGNVVAFVGIGTVVIGSMAYLVLVSLRFYR